MERTESRDDSQVALAALEGAARQLGVKVLVGVPFAAVLEVDSPALDQREARRALSGSFDYLLTDQAGFAAFAVAWQGPEHDSEPAAILRGALDEALCAKLGFPLLPVDASYLQVVEGTSLLSWLVQQFFVYQSWLAARKRGDPGAAEPYRYDLPPGWTPEPAMPLGDPFARSRALFRACRAVVRGNWRERCFLGRDLFGYDTALLFLPVGEGTVLGKGRLRALEFAGVNSRRLAPALAVADAFARIAKEGQEALLSAAEEREWRERASALRRTT